MTFIKNKEIIATDAQIIHKTTFKIIFFMSDDNLKAYIEQALKIRQTQENVSDEEMQKIALELGLSSTDLLKVESTFNDSLTRGKGFMKFKDWHSAIKELEYAIVLKPNSAEVLQALALCYTYVAALEKDDEIYEKAKQTVKNALLADPTHEYSFMVSSQLNKGIKNISIKQLDKNPFGMVKSNSSRSFDHIINLPKVFTKSRTDKKIFGVLGGISNYFGINSLILRLATTGAVLFPTVLGENGGIFVTVAYILLGVLMKKDPENEL